MKNNKKISIANNKKNNFVRNICNKLEEDTTANF